MSTTHLQRDADPMDVMVFRPSLAQRAAFGSLAMVAIAVVAAGVIEDSLVWLAFLVPSSLLLIETVRTKIVIDREHGLVHTTRSIRTSTFPIVEVVDVRVPPWGPMLLTLRASTVRSGANWPGQINTGIQVPHRGTDTAAHQLADCLDVPVESAWPGVRSPAAVADVRLSWVICAALVVLGAMLVALLVGEYVL